MSRRWLVGLVVVGMVVSGCTDQIRQTFGSQASNDWALDMTQLDELQEANLTGEGVRLAVVDSGVQGGHAEFQGVKILWKDFVNGQSEPYDDNGHGTHVSGLAVAQPGDGFNAPSIQGAAPGATLLHAKAIKGAGGSDSGDVADGIDWAVQRGADVLVLSLGEQPRRIDIDQRLEDSVKRALDAGVVVVAAAGNARQGESGRDCEVTSPANIPDVIAVGAVDENRQIAPFSCRGTSSSGPLGVQERQDPDKKPELTAPGVELIGPWPSRTCAGRADAKYCVLSGTSQATPIVGGIVAAILEENPDCQRQGRGAIDEIKTAFMQTAEKVNFQGHHKRYGYGIVQGHDALQRVDC